jgi:hypothetical protein
MNRSVDGQATRPRFTSGQQDLDNSRGFLQLNVARVGGKIDEVQNDFVVKCGKAFTKQMRVITEHTVVRCAEGYVFSTAQMTSLNKESEEKAAEFEEQTKKLTRARGQRALRQRQS